MAALAHSPPPHTWRSSIPGIGKSQFYTVQPLLLCIPSPGSDPQAAPPMRQPPWDVPSTFGYHQGSSTVSLPDSNPLHHHVGCVPWGEQGPSESVTNSGCSELPFCWGDLSSLIGFVLPVPITPMTSASKPQKGCHTTPPMPSS